MHYNLYYYCPISYRDWSIIIIITRCYISVITLLLGFISAFVHGYNVLQMVYKLFLLQLGIFYYCYYYDYKYTGWLNLFLEHPNQLSPSSHIVSISCYYYYYLSEIDDRSLMYVIALSYSLYYPEASPHRDFIIMNKLDLRSCGPRQTLYINTGINNMRPFTFIVTYIIYCSPHG